jgi:hypothetical protein
MLFFFSADSIGWQRISIPWQQDWMAVWLDWGLDARNYEKLGKHLQFPVVHSVFHLDSVAIGL